MSEEAKAFLMADVKQTLYGAIMEAALLKKCLERVIALETGKPFEAASKESIHMRIYNLVASTVEEVNAGIAKDDVCDINKFMEYKSAILAEVTKDLLAKKQKEK